MIKILFDHQIFSEQRYGGISRYFANLASEMNKDQSLSVKIAVLYVKNYYISKLKQPFDNRLGRWFLRKMDKRYRWNKKHSISLLKKGNYDIFHATYYDTYSLAYNRRPMVLTIHDMIYENSPEMFADSELVISQKKQMMEAADAIIAISNFTHSEIVKIYPEYAAKTRVVYHGLPEEITGEQSGEPLRLPQRFILFVGSRGHYKNFEPMVKALAPLFNQQKDLVLLCTGGNEFTAEEQTLLHSLGMATQCRQLNATDDDLKVLYQHALAFVYPSSQEGFGLPMLEAFKNNCPIACSNTSCLPEIGGDAAAYFNPEDGPEILARVQSILDDTSFANELRAKGRERLQHFSMANCVANTVQVYRDLLKRN